ncbi:MAG: NAD(P)-dependent oxidoreductase, partial [Pseudomonadota bacterium]|nr:NAD(P)-dependent oxidoreductase [Pseudomonadota bacterium]
RASVTTSPSDAPDLRGERVLVVGGRGFVGSHVVRALVAAGARPQLFGPRMAEDRLEDLAGRIDDHEGSITDRTSIDAALSSSRASAIVSCAAHGVARLGLMRSGEADADGAMAVNVTGLGKLLDAAREADIRRVVWTSSTVVYGPADHYGPEPVDEDAPAAPVTFYGLTKTLAETLADYHARRFGLSVVGLRLPLILGSGLWYQGAAAALAGLFEAARRGERYRLSFHDDIFDLMHVADVGEAVVAVLRHPGPLARVYNLEAFKACASDLVAEVLRQRPGLDIVLDRTQPPLLFPLITGERLARDVGFSARHDLTGFVAEMLAPDTAGVPT